MRVTGLTKAILFLASIGVLIFGYRYLITKGVVHRPSILKTMVPLKSDDINADVIQNNSNVKLVAMPSNTALQPCQDGNTRNCVNGVLHEMETWAWNANGGLDFAVGGSHSADGKGIQTSKGSLMEKYGVLVRVIRQDDSGQMKTDLLDTATRLRSDPNASGIKFVTVMGDGGAQFFKDLQKTCPTCNFEVVAVLGYSRGEDGFWGQKIWLVDPQKARGALIIGVLRDGDWNIAMKWAAQNGIPNNPDDTVYDPTALNWINADSFTKAAEMFVSGTCVDLPVKGKLTGGKMHVCANGVVTWTPGDVTIAKKKGGLVPIMTTKQSIFQMPAILVGITQWDAAHHDDVVKILAASFEGADQIRANPAALQRMGEIATTLYKEENAAYWVRYYKGVTEDDATGVQVPLGGSSVANLADNLQAFGLSNGPNLFAASYTTFGKKVVQQYPNMYPDFPPVDKILNTSFVRGVKALNTLPTDNAEDLSVKDKTAPMKSVEGRKDYAIQFGSGSSTILSSSFAVLDQLADEIVITKYGVALHGYTDASKFTGLTLEQSAEKNMQLSNDRAKSVEAYLRKKGLTNVIRPYPHGQEEPVADNATESGRAMNRRVKVVLGTL